MLIIPVVIELEELCCQKILQLVGYDQIESLPLPERLKTYLVNFD